MGHIPKRNIRTIYPSYTHVVLRYNATYSCRSDKMRALSIANHSECDTEQVGTRANNDFSFTDGGGD